MLYSLQFYLQWGRTRFSSLCWHLSAISYINAPVESFMDRLITYVVHLRWGDRRHIIYCLSGRSKLRNMSGLWHYSRFWIHSIQWADPNSCSARNIPLAWHRFASIRRGRTETSYLKYSPRILNQKQPHNRNIAAVFPVHHSFHKSFKCHHYHHHHWHQWLLHVPTHGLTPGSAHEETLCTGRYLCLKADNHVSPMSTDSVSHADSSRLRLGNCFHMWLTRAPLCVLACKHVIPPVSHTISQPSHNVRLDVLRVLNMKPCILVQVDEASKKWTWLLIWVNFLLWKWRQCVAPNHL